MISIHEFRVGNYVSVDTIVRRISLINNEQTPGQVPCIGFKINKENAYETCNSERLAPVPLTDQLLRDLGFIFHDYFKLWQHVKPDNSYSIELDRDYTALDFSHRPIIKNMKHIHSLQNLFFAVQGNELLINSFAVKEKLPVAIGSN
jgi:hypothetical protein